MSNIFIVGQHRTGSTLLKNVIGSHSDITMAFDEMNLFEPFRKNTLDKILAKGDCDAHKLTDLIQQGKIYGTFWRDFERSGISIGELRETLEQHNNLNAEIVVRDILKLLQKKNQTTISGIKYPLHVSKIDYLIKTFPLSVIVFLTRNPKAIIASKLNDSATQKRKSKSFLHRFLIHYFTLIYFSFEYVVSVKKYIHHKDNVILVTYEQMVINMRREAEKICNTLAIPFEESMLEATGKTSSYKSNQGEKLYKKSLNKYNEVLTGFDLKLIDVITKKYYNIIQYESGTDV